MEKGFRMIGRLLLGLMIWSVGTYIAAFSILEYHSFVLILLINFGSYYKVSSCLVFGFALDT